MYQCKTDVSAADKVEKEKKEADEKRETEEKASKERCQKARKAFAQANRDMRKQCSGECLRRASQCIRCRLGDELCDDDEDEDEDKPGRRRGRSSDPQEIKQVKQSLRACPLVSQADIKELKQDVKDVKEESKTLKKRY